MNQEIIPAYSAYQEVIDLTLYHAFVELIVQTAQDDEARILYRQLKTRQIWQKDQNVSGYFETYNLRYPGEVLERFEEKLGHTRCMDLLRSKLTADERMPAAQRLGVERHCTILVVTAVEMLEAYLQEIEQQA